MLENVFHRILQTMFGSGANISSSNPLPVTSETSLDSGVATGGGLTTLDDTLKGWQVNVWEDAMVEIMDISTGIAYTRLIDSNTATQLDFTTNPLPAAVVAGDTYTIKRVASPMSPISKANLFNQAGYLAAADILAADIAPTDSPTSFRIEAAFSAGGILSMDLTQAGVTVNVQLYGGVALNINSGYTFQVLINSGDTVNFQYSVNATILSFKVQEIPAATA